jgi:bifunctional pyridoxal-dependent enzyme with beta-cystathionase and maltose regulon repressor activities
LALTVFGPSVVYLLWVDYKEREWKSNNQDEWIYQEAERRGMNKRKSKQ